MVCSIMRYMTHFGKGPFWIRFGLFCISLWNKLCHTICIIIIANIYVIYKSFLHGVFCIYPTWELKLVEFCSVYALRPKAKGVWRSVKSQNFSCLPFFGRLVEIICLKMYSRSKINILLLVLNKLQLYKCSYIAIYLLEPEWVLHVLWLVLLRQHFFAKNSFVAILCICKNGPVLLLCYSCKVVYAFFRVCCSS